MTDNQKNNLPAQEDTPGETQEGGAGQPIESTAPASEDSQPGQSAFPEGTASQQPVGDTAPAAGESQPGQSAFPEGAAFQQLVGETAPAIGESQPGQSTSPEGTASQQPVGETTPAAGESQPGQSASPEGAASQQPVGETAPTAPVEMPLPQEGEGQPGQGTPQPVEAPVPEAQEPEYPRQGQPVPPPQQPWPGYGPQAGPNGPWGAYPPYGGYGTYGAQPVQGVPNMPAYGAYGAPAGPAQPWYGYAGGYGYGQPAQKPPRKKMSRGLKVFLWIASALVAGTVIGFSAFVISWAVTGQTMESPLVETLPETPSESQNPARQQEDSQPQVELPQVDVTPNEEGILIHEKPEGDPLDAQQVYDRVVQSTVAITVSTDGENTDSSGTGIIATSDGYIITNAHVVLNSKSVLVTVTTYDGQQYDAVVVGMDRTTDLAIIKTNDHNFTPAEFGDANELEIGEWVLAIGNPGGERFTSSLTRGIISGLDRAVERYSENGMTFIQTDAAINPGNSGGPLVNMYGQVVGINSSKIITDGYEGMGFAIPVSKAKDIIDQLLSGGYVEGRVRLGITGYDLNAAEAAVYGVPRGFMIASIDEDSSFAGTEAQVNDIIVAIDGEPVEELTDISNLLLRYEPGDQVTVTLYRMPETGIGSGEEIDVTITLLEDKGETQK